MMERTYDGKEIRRTFGASYDLPRDEIYANDLPYRQLVNFVIYSSKNTDMMSLEQPARKGTVELAQRGIAVGFLNKEGMPPVRVRFDFRGCHVDRLLDDTKFAGLWVMTKDAWYQLLKPATEYVPFFKPVALRTLRLLCALKELQDRGDRTVDELVASNPNLKDLRRHVEENPKLFVENVKDYPFKLFVQSVKEACKQARQTVQMPRAVSRASSSSSTAQVEDEPDPEPAAEPASEPEPSSPDADSAENRTSEAETTTATSSSSAEIASAATIAPATPKARTKAAPVRELPKTSKKRPAKPQPEAAAPPPAAKGKTGQSAAVKSSPTAQSKAVPATAATMVSAAAIATAPQEKEDAPPAAKKRKAARKGSAASTKDESTATPVTTAATASSTPSSSSSEAPEAAGAKTAPPSQPPLARQSSSSSSSSLSAGGGGERATPNQQGTMSVAIPTESAKPERTRTPTPSPGGFLGDIGRRPTTVPKKTNVLGPDYLYIRQQKQAARQKELERRQLQNPHLHSLVAVGVDEQPLPASNGGAKALRWKDTVQKQHIAEIQMFTREAHEWDEQFTTVAELASAATFADQRQAELMMERTKRQLARIANGGCPDEQGNANEADEDTHELDEETAANTAANAALGKSSASPSATFSATSTATTTPATTAAPLPATTAASSWLDQKPLVLAPLSLPPPEQQSKKREFGPMVFPPHKSPRPAAPAAPNMGMMMFPPMPPMMGPPFQMPQMPQMPVQFPAERLALPPPPSSSTQNSDLESCPF